MQRRHPLPRLWLMTDERQGEGLMRALRRLPRGAGVVFRHYGLPPRQRRELFEQVRRAARRRGQLVLLAGPAGLARKWGAVGAHDGGRRPGTFTAPAHSLGELRAAERAGAALVFVSPVFPTRSHPGGRTLGRVKFGLVARHALVPVIALGGMDRRRGLSLAQLGAYGWAGIDAWS